MTGSQKKEKEKEKEGTEGECNMQMGQVKENKGSTSKCSIQEGKYANYHVQQGIQEGTMDSSNITIKPLEENKRKSCKKMIQNERSKDYNESKKEKEQEVSFEELRLKKQQQQEEEEEEEEKDSNDEFELNIITSDDNLLNNLDHIPKGNNTNSGLKLPISDENDQNYYCLKQGVPKNTKFRSIVDIYKHTKRLSSPEQEYNWRRPSTLENQKSEVHDERKVGKDQVNTIQEILPNKQTQKVIDGEFESLGEHNQELNIDNRSNVSTKKNNDEDEYLNKGVSSESTIFKSLINLCEVIIEHETTEKHDKNISRKDHEETMEEEPIEEEQPEEAQQQQQPPNDNTGESELNKATSEDSLLNINPDHVLNDNDTNCGSKLWTKDENGGNYHITQGIPRSIKFRSISNLYECTTRLSLLEDEYNWNIPRGKDSNVNHLQRKESSDKKNSGFKRKCRENKKGKGEKDAAT